MYTKKEFFFTLCDAAKLGDFNTILALSGYTIAYSEMINDRNWKTGYAPLHIATYMNHTKAVETILKHYSFVNVNQGTLHEEKTSLMIAVEHKNVKSVSHLLQYGADPNIKDLYGHTPIYYLFANQYCDKSCNTIIKTLIKHGLNINQPVNIDADKPIHFVTIQFPNYNAAKLLLKNKANLNTSNEKGQIPLCEISKKFSTVDGNKLLKYAGYAPRLKDTCDINSYEQICAEYMHQYLPKKCTISAEIGLIMHNLEYPPSYFMLGYTLVSIFSYWYKPPYIQGCILGGMLIMIFKPLCESCYKYLSGELGDCIADI